MLLYVDSAVNPYRGALVKVWRTAGRSVMSLNEFTAPDLRQTELHTRQVKCCFFESSHVEFGMRNCVVKQGTSFFSTVFSQQHRPLCSSLSVTFGFSLQLLHRSVRRGTLSWCCMHVINFKLLHNHLKSSTAHICNKININI